MKNNYIDWGMTTYSEAVLRQEALVNKRIRGDIPDTLIFTEHHPVFTIGKRREAKEHFIWDVSECKRQNISIENTNRGGSITYHGPGQIVAYPIILLEKSRDLHKYLRSLEEVVINSIASYGLRAGRRRGKTGIWLSNRKICAIGIAVKRWVTYHGFALNVNMQLDAFNGIIPCGISTDDGLVTSLKHELNKECDLFAIKQTIALEFWQIFS